jgi:dTDP-glucose 4,6-dehydratase
MILVTGGAGFIGSNYVIQAITRGNHKVINLDKLTYAGNLETLKTIESNPNYRFIQGDIGDLILIPEILNKYQPKAVINFAAESHVDRSIHGPSEFIQTNVVGTFHLLESVRAYYESLSDDIRAQFRFLHVSTDEVYGTLSSNAPAFTENHPYEPNSPYAASKAASDHLVRAWLHTYGLPVITTNCSNNYGPYQFPEKLIPLIIYNALNEKPLPIYGDGLQIRDWLYVGDHCEALEVVLRNGRIGETYNIGGNNEKTNISVVKAICHSLDRLSPRKDHKSYAEQITYVKDRLGHDRRYAIDANKIKQDLGWAPQETFETGIEKTIRWYLSNSDWVHSVISGSYREWIAKQYKQ